MNNKLNILFITWDGPQTNYVEGLFMPIFHEIEKTNPKYKFHYLQFTWGRDSSSAQLDASKKFNIPYASVPVKKKPVASLGSMITLINGHKQIKYFVNKWEINALMPRSTFPVYMTQRAKLNLPIIFDADGLPIEERIDFANLKRGSLIHRFYKWIEKNGIKNSNLVITRSKKSIEYHLKNYNPLDKNKFYTVTNGRDISVFNPNPTVREQVRNELKISSDTTTFIYAGSFGPQYGWNEMLKIFKAFKNKDDKCCFIFLTGSPLEVEKLIPQDLEKKFMIKRVAFKDIPKYLNAADVAFAIREPSFSMKGVSPIKLGEYLLMGLPTIASKGIGDTTEILESTPGTFLYDHYNSPTEEEILEFLYVTSKFSRTEIRRNALSIFSLEASAKSYICALNTLG